MLSSEGWEYLPHIGGTTLSVPLRPPEARSCLHKTLRAPRVNPGGVIDPLLRKLHSPKVISCGPRGGLSPGCPLLQHRARLVPTPHPPPSLTVPSYQRNKAPSHPQYARRKSRIKFAGGLVGNKTTSKNKSQT